MKLIDKMRGRDLKIAKKILTHKEEILRGPIIAVDPGSNYMGWALFEGGELKKAGVAKGGKNPVCKRFFNIFDELPDYSNISVLVVEFVRTNTGHEFLTFSNGISMAKYGSPIFIEVTNTMWKKNVPKEYEKSDVNDAIAIGQVVIDLCKENQ